MCDKKDHFKSVTHYIQVQQRTGQTLGTFGPLAVSLAEDTRAVRGGESGVTSDDGIKTQW